MASRATPAARRPILRDGLVLFGLLATAYWYLVLGDANWHGPSADGLVYWAVDPANPYRDATVGGANAYLYSPAFAQIFSIIGRLPREVFIVAWTAFIAAAAAWLARPWPAGLLILLLPVSQDVVIGNVHVLMAAAIVLGFRWPATWAFVLLTKVTPGIGLVWFLVRREWRSLAIAAGATAAITLVSFALAPNLWFDWVRLLRSDGGNESARLIPRLILAAAICAWGALTDRRWAVPLASMLALPVIWSDSFAVLLGCVALGRAPARRDAEPASPRIRPEPESPTALPGPEGLPGAPAG
ncbi:MAG TPA: glycosyltransferase family 87 protein [Candidatus Limnocylindrales bacterium]|jgi:hypothetical protein